MHSQRDADPGARRTSRGHLAFLLPLLVAAAAPPAVTVARPAGQDAIPIPEELSLEAARQILLQNDPVILGHRQAVAAARADLVQAEKIPNPYLQVAVDSFDFGDDAGPFLDRQEAVVGVGHTLELGGKRPKRTRVGRESMRVAEAALEDVVRRRQIELARRYYGLQVARTDSRLAEALRADFDRVIELAEERLERGEASGLEVLRLRTERIRFVEEELGARLAMRRERIALAAILGVTELPAGLTLTDELEAPEAEPAAAGLPGAVEASRPDIQAQQRRVEAGRATVEHQRSLTVPDLRSFLGYKRDFGSSTVAASFAFDLPITDRNQGGVSRARAELAADEVGLRGIRVLAHAELAEARARAMIGRARVQALRDEGVPSAERAREIARAAYDLGSIDLVELLDVERAYRETLRSYHAALYEHRIAVISARAAAGLAP